MAEVDGYIHLKRLQFNPKMGPIYILSPPNSMLRKSRLVKYHTLERGKLSKEDKPEGSDRND
jgi:hypothetical protein